MVWNLKILILKYQQLRRRDLLKVLVLRIGIRVPELKLISSLELNYQGLKLKSWTKIPDQLRQDMN